MATPLSSNTRLMQIPRDPRFNANYGDQAAQPAEAAQAPNDVQPEQLYGYRAALSGSNAAQVAQAAQAALAAQTVKAAQAALEAQTVQAAQAAEAAKAAKAAQAAQAAEAAQATHAAEPQHLYGYRAALSGSNAAQAGLAAQAALADHTAKAAQAAKAAKAAEAAKAALRAQGADAGQPIHRYGYHTAHSGPNVQAPIAVRPPPPVQYSSTAISSNIYGSQTVSGFQMPPPNFGGPGAGKMLYSLNLTHVSANPPVESPMGANTPFAQQQAPEQLFAAQQEAHLKVPKQHKGYGMGGKLSAPNQQYGLRECYEGESSEDEPLPPVQRSHQTKLIVSHMPQDMNEEGLQTMFSKYGAIRFCKLMRSATGASLDFGFVEFVDYRCAQAAQILLNGRHIGENVLRVSYDIGNSKQEKHANLYVARLPLTVDEGRLLHMFSVFGSIESVKVIRNRETNISRGIAFVRFDALQSAVMAVEALHNTIPNGFFRPMEVKYVNPNHKGKLDRGPPRRHNLNRPDPSYTNSFKMNMVPSWVLQTFPIDPCTENQDLSEQHSKRPNEEPEEDEDFDCKRPCGFYYDDSN